MFISTKEEVSEFLVTASTFDFKRIKFFLDDTNQTYIKPLLENEYDDLVLFYRNKETDPEKNALIKELQRATVNLAYFNGFELLTSKIENTGIFRMEDENTKPLFARQEKAVKNIFAETGFAALDRAAAMLEKAPDKYPKYAQSPTVRTAALSLVRTTTEFNSIYEIGSSRQIFMKSRATSALVCDKHIKSRTGDKLFNSLIEKRNNNTLSEKETDLLLFLQKAAVYLTIAESNNDFILLITGKQFAASGGKGSNEAGDEGAVSLEYITQIKEKANENGFFYLDKALKIIATNPVDFPPETPFEPRTAVKKTGKIFVI